MLKLSSKEVELQVDPWRGGSVQTFTWRGIDVFRPGQVKGSPLSLGCFPLVPFCNRIADCRIGFDNLTRMLPVPPDGVETVHALHGIGWTSPWSIAELCNDYAVLSLRHDGALWPWAFTAEQRFEILENGYSHTISVINRDVRIMPTGLGLHPYFPRAGVTLDLQSTGVWQTGVDRLPAEHIAIGQSPNWFAGRGFDDCFTGCSHPITIRWPSHQLTMSPSPNMSFTHVYTPPGEDFFCVEPVSHIPDAVNSDLDHSLTGLVMLEPGQSMSIACQFELEGRA